MRTCTWALAGTILICGSVAAQESGRSSVQCDQPVPLSETGLRFGWETEPENSPFRQGSWVSMGYGAVVLGVFTEDVRMYSLYGGMGYYFSDNISLNVNLGAHFGDQDVDRETQIDTGDFFGGSVEFLMRNHVVNYGTWSAFVDGGLGFSLLTQPVPADATAYNFVLTAGVGIIKQLDDCTHFIGGVRWYHLSNGSFFNSPSKNAGYDGKMIYAGLLYSY